MLQTGHDIYSIEDTPSWVKTYAVPKTDSPSDSPLRFPLVDYQELIGDSEICSYRNTYQCVDDASRIEDASLHLTELHQGSQKLLIHELSIVRDGNKIDSLDLENITAIQRERSLESHITDNRITVSISIDDLRVGDHVQYRSTVVESQTDHPFHGRHFSANYSLSWACPVNLQIVRIVNNSKDGLRVLHQELNSDEQAPTEFISPGEVFERQYLDLPIEHIPDAVPEWVWGSFIQVTSNLEWKRLSQYLYAYFEKNAALSKLSLSDVEKLTIFNHDDTLEQKALKIIRFVQNNVRYRGENHGVFTHTPKTPERTLKKRAGDCKDKSNLMLALLESIGVTAHLVLVNTSFGKKISEFNPSPYHFNHMIVDVEFEGQHFYVDATVQKQAGDFKHAAQLDYGFGLPLSSEGSHPVDILKSLQNKVFELTHNFDFPRDQGKLRLVIQRVYHFHRADNMRSYFGSNEKSKYQQEFLGWAKGDTGLDLEVITPVFVEQDDTKLNKLVVKEEYQIANLMTTHDNKPIELLTDFYQNFPTPNSDEFDIRIDLDGVVQHDIFLKYDGRPDMQTSKEKFATDAFEYLDIVEEVKGNQLHYITRVTPLKSFVTGGAVARQHKKDVERMRQRSNNLIRYKNKTFWSKVLDNQLMWYVFFIAVFLVIKAIIASLK